MDQLICCFTGHRTIDKKHLSKIYPTLLKLLNEKYDMGFRVFRAGGAQGFDTIAALSVLELRRQNPDVILELILPCRDQADKWHPAAIEMYRAVLERADSVTYAEEYYTACCMHKRNRMLVNGSNCCIAYYNDEKIGSSGTEYTCKYAASHGVELINLWKLL